jgi:hypothetical protein
MDRVLALPRSLGIRATFFIVGRVAEAHPAMVKKITKAAHEIACHAYRHEACLASESKSFVGMSDVQRAILEDLSGKAVIGYRAPNYSIGQDPRGPTMSSWRKAFSMIRASILFSMIAMVANASLSYDIRDNGVQKLINFRWERLDGSGANLPIGGRWIFSPYRSLVRRGIRRVNKEEGNRDVLFSSLGARPSSASSQCLGFSFRHYVGIDRLEAKSCFVFSSLSFTVRDVLK